MQALLIKGAVRMAQPQSKKITSTVIFIVPNKGKIAV